MNHSDVKKIVCSIDFDTDIEKARSVIKNAMEQCKQFLKISTFKSMWLLFLLMALTLQYIGGQIPNPANNVAHLMKYSQQLKMRLIRKKYPMTYSTPVSFLEPLIVHNKEKSKNQNQENNKKYNNNSES